MLCPLGQWAVQTHAANIQIDLYLAITCDIFRRPTTGLFVGDALGSIIKDSLALEQFILKPPLKPQSQQRLICFREWLVTLTQPQANQPLFK